MNNLKSRTATLLCEKVGSNRGTYRKVNDLLALVGRETVILLLWGVLYWINYVVALKGTFFWKVVVLPVTGYRNKDLA